MRAVAQRANLVGMDVVEVSPPYDVAQLTALHAARLILDTVGAAFGGENDPRRRQARRAARSGCSPTASARLGVRDRPRRLTTAPANAGRSQPLMALTRALMWAGVVPQQPPTMLAPCATMVGPAGGELLRRLVVDGLTRSRGAAGRRSAPP